MSDFPHPPVPSPQPPRASASSQPPRLILASSSPRRRELLSEAGYEFEIIPPADDVECGVCSESGPAGLVAELAYRKATAVRQQLLHNPQSEIRNPKFTVVLAADTVAECDGFILGKPRDEADARAMLTKLSGREHRVLTGVCLIPVPLPCREGLGEGSVNSPPNEPAQPLIRVAVTKLQMDPLTSLQLDDYLASGAWEGKAGAFGYQDRLGWVRVVEGSESNVVGLPMELLAEMLVELKAGSTQHGAGSAERR
jgi:septum formation protein